MTLALSGYSLLSDMGWPIHDSGYTRLRNAIVRLTAAKLQVGTDDWAKAFSGSFILNYEWDFTDPDDGSKSRSKWLIQLDQRIVSLFTVLSPTLLAWDTRKNLKGGLTLWLHSFFSVEGSDLHPIPVQRIRELCGSTDVSGSFKRNLVTALDRLKDGNFLSRWSIQEGALHVVKCKRMETLGLQQTDSFEFEQD